MKNFALAVLLLSLAPFLCSAQNFRQYLACSQNAQTQAAMNACADREELKRADADLNGTYRSLLAKTAPQPETAAKIKVRAKSLARFLRLLSRIRVSRR